MSPATTPRKIAGKVGPPRKFPSEIDQASPLNRSSSVSVESEMVAACPKSVPKASWPEKSTASGDLSVASAKAIARPPTASPADDREQERIVVDRLASPTGRAP